MVYGVRVRVRVCGTVLVYLDGPRRVTLYEQAPPLRCSVLCMVVHGCA